MIETLLGYRLTKHARCRCAQRAYRLTDIELVLEYGTPTHEGVLLRHRDILEPIKELRHQIRRIQRDKRKRTGSD